MTRTTSFGSDGRAGPARPMPARPGAIRPEDEAELKRALDAYKERSGRQFPTWSEILEVLRALGYAKRVWRPVEPLAGPGPGGPALGGEFRWMGEDMATGIVGWFSRVETTAGC